MVFVPGPVLLIALQVLDAWFFAVVAGVGLTLFQQVIPRPGLASGMFVNTRRLGAIVSGAVIGLGSLYAAWLWGCLRGLRRSHGIGARCHRCGCSDNEARQLIVPDTEIASKGEPQGHQ